MIILVIRQTNLLVKGFYDNTDNMYRILKGVSNQRITGTLSNERKTFQRKLAHQCNIVWTSFVIGACTDWFLTV